MDLFRRLAGNIFFKIVLAFVALSFVLFGISGFILGSPNSWVAKIGNTTIGLSYFNKSIQADRDIIISANKSPEAMKYLESDQFKSDVLARIVNKAMIEKLHEEYGVVASKKLILEAVAKNKDFLKDNKFNHELFESFLKRNGINEEKYVNLVSNEVVAAMIMQTMSMVSPLNAKAIIASESFKQEQRVADVVTISIRDIKSAPQPSQAEIEKFFSENQKNYTSPPMRKVSYISFSKKDFLNDLKLSDGEIAAEYEKNKAQYQNPETRSFYHILFEKEDEAKAFISKLGSDKGAIENEFLKFAKEKQKKDKKAITIDIAKKDLIPQLAEVAFKLKIGEYSNALNSPLGFHVFLLRDVKSAATLPLSQVREKVAQDLMNGREEKVLQAKISEIDDMILSSNSLAEVAKKFNLKLSQAIKINQNAQNENGQEVKEIEALGDFVANAFALKKNQISKIFYAEQSNLFYAIKVEEIEESRARNLEEVRLQVVADLLQNMRQKMMHELAGEVAAKIKQSPNDIAQIAAKYQLKFEKSREFPRIYYVDYQGQKIPYQNKFLDELFAIKINEATPLLAGGAQELVVGVLREIKKVAIGNKEIEAAKKVELNSFRSEIMQEFNSYLLKKHPVKVNDKILGKKE